MNTPDFDPNDPRRGIRPTRDAFSDTELDVTVPEEQEPPRTRPSVVSRWSEPAPNRPLAPEVSTEANDAVEHAAPRTGFQLASLFGVAVHVDWSLFVIVALIAFNLGAGVFPHWHPTWHPLTCWALALAASLAFFASILVHELSHAFVGRAMGIPVRRITLFLFGGVAHMEGHPKTPLAELLMAGVGPLTSLSIGVFASGLGALLAGPEVVFDFVRGIESAGPIATLLLWLGPINVTLAILNLVPGFPLDGGRVLRAALWAVTRDLKTATKWASFLGQLVAWTLMAIGVVVALSGNFVQGLWLVLIGWFLNNAARASYEQLLVHESLLGVPAARVMRTQLDRISPELTVDQLVRDHWMATDQHAFPVEENGILLGLVCIEDVRKLPANEWPIVTVREVMTPANELSTVAPDAPAEEALEALARRDVGQIPVVQGLHLLGLVQRSDLVRWLTLHTPSGQRAMHARGARGEAGNTALRATPHGYGGPGVRSLTRPDVLGPFRHAVKGPFPLTKQRQSFNKPLPWPTLPSTVFATSAFRPTSTRARRP